MSDWVFVEREPMAGREHPAKPGTTIGRTGCDVNVQDPELSRSHAQIRQLDSGLAIEDLDSTNGTLVNGERITGMRGLRDGDVVKFGNTVWKLQAPASVTQGAGDPQLTVARPVPGGTSPPPESAPPRAAAPPAPVAPRAPARAAPAPAAGAPRGDVPAPDFAPSAIRRIVPPPGGPAAFSPPRPASGRGSRATRVEATVAAYVATALVAGGVVAYYITKPFE